LFEKEEGRYQMARILADHEIKKILNLIIIGAEEKYMNPNGIELRLGKKVRFCFTEEEKELSSGSFLRVNPGETIVISSLEKIDFTAATVQAIYPNSMLMGLITPTTTMMREGISQVSTKIDAGFRGILNWALRNGSTKDLIIQYGEPIFKLTIFLLDTDEVPMLPYGERENDSYQDAKGVVRSARRIPADIPKNRIISSSFDKLDPKKQLREAGYPFDHIGTELVNLHGKFEVVSKDVMLLKDEFDKRTDELSAKIVSETGHLSEKLNEFRQSFFERVEAIFAQKFLRVVGILIGAISVMYGGISFLETKNVSGNTRAFSAVIVGIVVLVITYCLTLRSK
jgi:deoxycytidine triphosphate deaminase